MNYTIMKELPPIEEMIKASPISAAAREQIKQDREEIKKILEGTDKRFLMIVGPCSAWPKEAVLEYAHRFLNLNKKVKHAMKLVMRVYSQKPRTIKGWTGPVHQPDLFSAPDIEAGVQYTRDMMIKIIEMGLPIADEPLFMHHSKSFLELLSWVAIGARSAEDQERRIFASALNCPVGLKNSTHGSLVIAVNSIVTAQHSHFAMLDGYAVQTHGNAYAHLVLRGSIHAPNYSLSHLEEVKRYMDQHQLRNPSVIIDASHDNCLTNGKKAYRQQPKIIETVIESLNTRPELKSLVKGFMLESFLKDGNQHVDSVSPTTIDMSGLSITDPCLSWEETETFLLKLANGA